MMDKLLEILRTDPDYKNFTLDGQTIPIEDYLEVKPEKEEDIKKYVKEKRLSIGPMYILPDEFLISGESMVRNLLIGHNIAKRFGRVMKAGYIPDPFGHIAQLPQIISGFEVPSILFWRGFGNEFEENKLNVEFMWNAPGNAASTLTIFLASGYGSLANLKTKQLKDGSFRTAHRTIGTVIKRFEKLTATPIVVLNSGSDHHEAKPEIPAIIKQWNELNPDKKLEQNDFEYYVEKVLECNPELKTFQGELRGGKYAHLLSGVFSARMWIKQRNTKIEYLYEKYAEPLSTITWALDKSHTFEYPKGYLLTGLKWLIKNHPHDSICGCSIDQVHDEMKIRFDWAEQIATEIIKSSFLHLEDLINIDTQDNSRLTLIVYNSLPWKRKDVVAFNCVVLKQMRGMESTQDMKIIDANGNEIEYQSHPIKEEPRYTQELNESQRITFLAELPPCGYRVYYLIPDEKPQEVPLNTEDFKIAKNIIENEFYRVIVYNDGQIEVYDKESDTSYEKVCQFEDVGDWGDEYDYSGPKPNQVDIKYTTQNASVLEIAPFLDGPSHKTLKIRLNLMLPVALMDDRSQRDEKHIDNEINVYISLYKGIKRVNFKIEYENNAKDHRIRAIFPSNIKTDKVYADGHFYVVPRDVDIPVVEKWSQKPLPTNHQKDFIAAYNESKCVAVLNKGLPEYEAIRNEDGTVSLAITLLRCIEWLSRGDFATRASNAGPDLNTPGAQEIGKHTFELSFVIENKKGGWIESEMHVKGKEFNNPFSSIFPLMTRTPLRIQDKLILTPLGILSYFITAHKKVIKSFLPTELSFLEIDNKKVVLSALKKSEEGDFLIVRVYNISTTSQTATLKFNEIMSINDVKIVNLLENEPNNEIKAKCTIKNAQNVELELEPHVIATIRLDFELK